MGLADVEVIRLSEGVAVAVFSGEHDVTSSDATLDLLIGLVTENELSVVDIGSAQFIDSSFLHNLAYAQNTAERRGSRLVLQFDAEAVVMKALEISGMLRLLKCVTTREEALNGGGRHAGGARHVEA